MLEELRIRGLGVIADATLDLSPGLTVLTGETGAGKTMVLQGLSLATGGRADSALLRSGVARAAVDARFQIATTDVVDVRDRVIAAGGELDDGDVLLVSRSVTAEGRSRAAAGGSAVPASVLVDLTDGLVSIHGQHAQQRLRRGDQQRQALDRYGGPDLARLLDRYRAVWTELTASRRELAEVTGQARERAQEAELLRSGLDRINAVGPQPGEERELDAEIERLGHAETLRTAAAAAHGALAGADAGTSTGWSADLQSVVAEARRTLAAAVEHDPALAALEQRLAELSYLSVDLAADLASYADGVEADPLRLEVAQTRRAALTGLARAWGPTTEDVLAWAETAGTRLEALDGDDTRGGELTATVARLDAELAVAAKELTAARVAVADRFADAVGTELHGLAMPQAEIVVALTPLDAPGPWGAEDVEIQLRPHPGSAARALGRGASGGELSRVMLALEVVLAGCQEPGLLVFDEVDAGVGGRAAVEVGRRLARLSQDQQVLVVTHLPQVAAFADHHLVVVKSEDGTITESGVRTLDHEGRVAELSRMLAGLEDSESARAHAQELLDLAEHSTS